MYLRHQINHKVSTTKKLIMNGNSSQRLPQESKCPKVPDNTIMEEAEAIAQRVLESIKEVAGTTNCKGVQIEQLKKRAIENDYWIDSINGIGIYADRGSENEVYLSIEDNSTVYKLNDFRYSDDNLCSFFFRLKAQQTLFPD